MARCLTWLMVVVGMLLGNVSEVRSDTIIIETGEDTAPYSFVPNLPRFNNPTLYAFTAQSDTGTTHQFETYIRFDVSIADIPPGHVLTDAIVVTTYGFDFTAFGDTSTDPGVLDCRNVLESWDQTTLNFTNRPLVDIPFDTIIDIDSFGALICDATPLVAGWVYGFTPNNGVALTSQTPRVMGMYSFEADVSSALMPTLILTTEVPEPGFGAALAMGGTALGLLRRRSRGLG